MVSSSPGNNVLKMESVSKPLDQGQLKSSLATPKNELETDCKYGKNVSRYLKVQVGNDMAKYVQTYNVIVAWVLLLSAILTATSTIIL